MINIPNNADVVHGNKPALNNSGGGKYSGLIVFVTGYSRSGTTMMGRILGNNPEVFMFHELHFFEQLYAPGKLRTQLSPEAASTLLSRLISIQRQGYLQKKKPALFANEARSVILESGKNNFYPHQVFELFLRYESMKNSRYVPLDQTPRNILYLREILSAFPQSKAIIMIRDPRDALLSQKKKWARKFLGASAIPLKESFRSWINYHPYTITKLWMAAAKHAIKWTGHSQVKIIQFENLLHAPEKNVRDVCTFLGIEFNPAMLQVPNIGSSTANDSHEKLGINPLQTGKWKQGLNKTEVYVCEKLTENIYTQFGYVSSGTKPDFFALAGYALIFPVKIILALLFNFHRAGNMIEAIKRRM